MPANDDYAMARAMMRAVRDGKAKIVSNEVVPREPGEELQPHQFQAAYVWGDPRACWCGERVDAPMHRLGHEV